MIKYFCVIYYYGETKGYLDPKIHTLTEKEIENWPESPYGFEIAVFETRKEAIEYKKEIIE